MAKQKIPTTQAVRVLRANKVAFKGYLYRYIKGGGTAQFAAEMGVDEHLVVKTLILEDQDGKPMIMLMHGDQEVSTKALARQLGLKSITPCAPATADRHSGYQVGGTSPFGTRTTMPVYYQATILDLPTIYINGGKRGFSISMESSEMVRVLRPVPVSAAQ